MKELLLKFIRDELYSQYREGVEFLEQSSSSQVDIELDQFRNYYNALVSSINDTIENYEEIRLWQIEAIFKFAEQRLAKKISSLSKE